MEPTTTCVRCGEAPFELLKCPICFQRMCEPCSLNISGRRFCSQHCAEYFFHGDDDADERRPEE